MLIDVKIECLRKNNEHSKKSLSMQTIIEKKALTTWLKLAILQAVLFIFNTYFSIDANVGSISINSDIPIDIHLTH